MTVTPWLLLVLLAVTTARVTRLLVADMFPPIAVARARLTGRYSEHSWQTYLASCPWCLGVWVAGVLTAVADWRYSVPAPLMYWASSAWVAGFLSVLEQHDADDEEG